MRLLSALRSRLFGDENAKDTVEMNAVSGRQERAAGRILDDEGLRGDLADDEFQPLLDWALAQSDQAAAATASLDDEAADTFIEAAVSAVREVLRATQDVITAHAEGRTDDRREALDAVSQVWKPSVVGGDDTDLPRTLWRPLQELADRLDAEPELPGAEVATAIVSALTPAQAPSTEMASGDGEAAS